MTYKQLMTNANDLKGVIDLTGIKPKAALDEMAKSRRWSKYYKALVHEITFLLRVNRRQVAHLLAMLKTGHTITREKALANCGCQNLSARISELRDMGYGIAGEMAETPEGAQKIYWLA